MARAGAWILENGHRALLAISRGRWPTKLAGMPTLELHVVGRKTGRQHSTLLTAPICDDARVVIVASNAGHSDDPQWYKNLVVNPCVEVTIDGQTRVMTARTASGQEREELWGQITATFHNYDRYQASTTRRIPVVVCEPA